MTLFRSRRPRIHFVGIGGIGMSGIAELLLNLGYAVSGSDLRESEITRRLAGLGGRIAQGHAAANVADADVVVISSAVRRDNPEVVEARARKIPVIPRAEMLAELMHLRQGIAIAGSHGKTTTTSIAAHVLAYAGLDPTAVVGGKVNSFGSNAKLGHGPLMVVEADESDGSFLRISPTVAVVTNVDPEHLDHWHTPEALRKGFVDFVNRVPFYGLAILCIDHPTVQSLLPDVEKRYVTYGESHQADYRAEAIEVSGHSVRFDAFRRGEPIGRFEVAMVGRHNALNALAVIAI
ncbi:MAG TPA: UDP-N-acetylmuramate--L-alanine ligase, partial [Anaeromyxobacteraceae bacterium]|nr:UDP-N-acetylmuramate--L-alanine ligase [Anaeromyxobacteraceae bacterium]